MGKYKLFSLWGAQKRVRENPNSRNAIFKGVSRDHAPSSDSNFSMVTIFTTVTRTSVAFLRSSREG